MAIPNVPLVLPNWGESLGKGLERGFDAVMDGLQRRYQYAQLAQQKRRQDLLFTSQTGYDPNRLEQGQDYGEQAGAGQTLTPPQQNLFDEWQQFGKDMSGQRKSKQDLQSAQARKANEEADWLESLEGKPPIETFEEGGIPFYRTYGKSGPRTAPVPNAVQTVEEKRYSVMSAEGLRSVNLLKELASLPEGQMALRKAAGSFHRFFSLADPTAQKMRLLIQKVGDARARPMTGAAINAVEEDRYFNGLLGWERNAEANAYALDLEARFFEDSINAFGSGRQFNVGTDIRSRDMGAAKEQVNRPPGMLPAPSAPMPSPQRRQGLSPSFAPGGQNDPRMRVQPVRDPNPGRQRPSLEEIFNAP